jgi:magnesium-transporting ATPase (P-type)
MCELNNVPDIPRREIEDMMKEDEGTTNNVSLPLSEMFNEKYKESSIRLISSWFSVCFIYYGVMLLLPSILQRVFNKTHGSQNFKYFFIVVISVVEVGAFYFSSKIMDHPNIGRKKSVYYGLGTIFFVTMLIMIFG